MTREIEIFPWITVEPRVFFDLCFWWDLPLFFTVALPISSFFSHRIWIRSHFSSFHPTFFVYVAIKIICSLLSLVFFTFLSRLEGITVGNLSISRPFQLALSIFGAVFCGYNILLGLQMFRFLVLSRKEAEKTAFSIEVPLEKAKINERDPQNTSASEPVKKESAYEYFDVEDIGDDDQF